MTDSPWDEPTSCTTTTLSAVLTDKFFRSVQIEAGGYQVINLLHGGFTYFTQWFCLFQLWSNCLAAMTWTWYFKDTFNWIQNFSFPYFQSRICWHFINSSYTVSFSTLSFQKTPRELQCVSRLMKFADYLFVQCITFQRHLFKFSRWNKTLFFIELFWIISLDSPPHTQIFSM